MGPGLGWTLPLIRSNARIRRRRKGGPVNKKKRSRPVVTGQRAAQRKNSSRQWGRPFGRAPREICPAISTHPQLGRGLHHHVEVAGRWCRFALFCGCNRPSFGQLFDMYLCRIVGLKK